MSDRVRILLLLLILAALVISYFVLIQYLIGSCVEIGHYNNGQPILDCTVRQQLTPRTFLSILLR